MVSVFLRIKPSTLPSILVTTATTVTVNQMPFVFDQVIPATATQTQVYEIVARPLLKDVLAGYNVTICSYGQTGSGKTFTTFGTTKDQHMLGYAFRATTDLLETMPPGTRIGISCLEIYMENVYDLLDSSTTLAAATATTSLPIREYPNGSVYVPNLIKKYVRSNAEITKLWQLAETKRAVAATLMNSRSSRSHCILQVSVEQANGLLSLFNVVDLAGSERIKRSGASGEILKQAQSINTSLFTLAHVINLLADRKPTGPQTLHIPYRDSKLTRLLQDSLGGTAKTAMIITIVPTDDSQEETISSLRFAVRCKSVYNTPKINLATDSLEACQKRLADAEAEIARLRAREPITPPPAHATCPRCEQLALELEMTRTSTIAPTNLDVDWEKMGVKLPNQWHDLSAPELRQLVTEFEAAQKFMKTRQQILYNAILTRTCIIQSLEKQLATLRHSGS